MFSLSNVVNRIPVIAIEVCEGGLLQEDRQAALGDDFFTV